MIVDSIMKPQTPSRLSNPQLVARRKITIQDPELT